MARFEFSGTPSVTPTGPPSDEQRISASPEMFGGLIARGEQTLGQGVEHVADAGFDVLKFQHKVNADYETNNYIAEQNKLLYGDPTKSTTGPDGKPIPDLGYYGLTGRDASDRRGDTLKALDDLRQRGRNNLPSADAQLEYDAQTKRMYADAYAHTGAHAESQWKSWAGDVNQTRANLALDSFVNRGFGKEDAETYIDYKVKQAQAKYGNDPDITKGVVESARRDLLKAHTDRIAVDDPAAALKLLNEHKDVAGTQYDDMANKLRARAEIQTSAQKAGTYFTAARSGPAPVMTAQPGQPAAPIGADRVHDAIIKQESGGNPNERTSINGAVGIGQIMPATFQQYAKPGESINNPRDNLAVSKRIIDDYYQRFGGDPQRVAVAYFSGPGNVSPPGSVNPWKRDVADGNGKTVSSYVNDVSGRLGMPTAAVKASAFQMAMNDPELQANPQAMHRTLTDIAQLVNAQEIAENQTAKQKHDHVEGVVGGYVTELYDMAHSPNPDFVALAGRVNHDPALADQPEKKMALMERIKHYSGEEQQIGFGPGWRKAREGLFSEPGTPGHIDSMSDLIMRDDITQAGLADLQHRWTYAKGSIDRTATERKVNLFLKDAYKQLSFEDPDNPFVKIRDPKGEHIYNAQFAPQFIQRVSELQEQAEKTGDHKKLDEFLTEKSVREFAGSFRKKGDMDRDRMAAQAAPGQAAEPAGTPLPPTPEGLSDTGWHDVIAKPPLPGMNHAQWSGALQTLVNNPTPPVIEKFDQHFKVAGFDAKETLRKLGVSPEALAAIEKAEGATPPKDEWKMPAGQEWRFPFARPPATLPTTPAPSAAPAAPAAPAVPAYHGGRTSTPTEAEIQAQEREIAARRAERERSVAQTQAGRFGHTKPGTAPVHGAEAIQEQERQRKARVQEQLSRLDRDEAEARENITNKRQLERELKRIADERAKLK